eukprot:Nk52_evm4s249 gene=Nk52_evmTU4s249
MDEESSYVLKCKYTVYSLPFAVYFCCQFLQEMPKVFLRQSAVMTALMIGLREAVVNRVTLAGPMKRISGSSPRN